MARKDISSACCTRFIKGNLIGFAVRDGDDETPYVADWTSDDIWPLTSAHLANTENADSDRQFEQVCNAVYYISMFTMKD